MKKFFLIILLLLFSLFCSCDNNKNNLYKEPTNIKSSYNQTTNENVLFWSPFSFTENQVVFSNLIKDNPIDKANHLAESECDGTTQGMMDVHYQFADIWMQELEYSVENFMTLLNKEEKLVFEKTQSDWETYLSNNQKFLNSVLTTDKYGQMISVETAYEYKNEIRNRALYVKYLQFTLNNSDEKTLGFKWQ